MQMVKITLEKFLEDHQGRTFSDVVKDPGQPLDTVFEFFNDDNIQRRMEESEIHHDRPPLAGVVRELESHPAIDRSLAETHTEQPTITASHWCRRAHDHGGPWLAKNWP